MPEQLSSFQTSFQDDADVLDPSAQDLSQFQAPSVQWIHGSTNFDTGQGIQYSGGFFFPYEQCGEDAKIAGWAPAFRKVGGGTQSKKIEGLGCNKAAITIARYRKRWIFRENNRMVGVPWNAYDREKKMRAHLQCVGFIKGYEDPVA